MRIISVIICAFLSTACGHNNSKPDTLAESRNGHVYIPLDPLPVSRQDSVGCKKKKALLDALPDLTSRLATKKFTATGNVQYGVFTTSAKNEQFEIILDYMKTDTAPGTFIVSRKVSRSKPYKDFLFTYKRVDYEPGEVIGPFEVVPPSIETQYDIRRYKEGDVIKPNEKKIRIPIYVGLGIRMRAQVATLTAEAKLSSLPIVAAEVAAGNLSGQLVVQTIGVTGETIDAVMPLPAELNETTLTNSLLAMGGIKAQIYSLEDKNTTARIIGFYNPYGFAGEDFNNALIEVLADNSHVWNVPCAD